MDYEFCCRCFELKETISGEFVLVGEETRFVCDECKRAIEDETQREEMTIFEIMRKQEIEEKNLF